MWEVRLAETFREWLRVQDDALKKRIAASLLNLQHYGQHYPGLTLTQSKAPDFQT